MQRDRERIARIQDALKQNKLDAIVATLPSDVLLLSGYWPVTGMSIAVATRDCLAVLVPEDERELAQSAWSDVVQFYSPYSLTELKTGSDALQQPLRDLFSKAGIHCGTVGCRRGPQTEASSYAAMHLLGNALPEAIREICPGAAVTACDEVLRRLRSVLTNQEQITMEAACEIAGRAMEAGAAALIPGQRETEAAAVFQTRLHSDGTGWQSSEGRSIERGGGFVYCMSGANSALAGASYARSRSKIIEQDDVVLVHCNSYADGLWTDITRTYCFNPPSDRTLKLYGSILKARDAAFELIRPGAKAADIDKAARRVFASERLDQYFTHATGHGVGFGPFNPNSPPRLHPASPDVLEEGIVFNVEPALYFENQYGFRHCDMVLVTKTGYRLLTPFPVKSEDLCLKAARSN